MKFTIRSGYKRHIKYNEVTYRSSEVMTLTHVPEISITVQGAVPGMAVWAEIEPVEALPLTVRQARMRRDVSLMAKVPPCRSTTYRQPDGAVMAQIGWIVAEARPDLIEFLR